MDEVDHVPLVKDQECIRLHMAPLASSIKSHAKEWIKCYGNILHDSAKTGLNSLKHELEVGGTMNESMLIYVHLYEIYDTMHVFE